MSLARHTVRKTARLRGLLPAVHEVYLGGAMTGQLTSRAVGLAQGVYSAPIMMTICVVGLALAAAMIVGALIQRRRRR